MTTRARSKKTAPAAPVADPDTASSPSRPVPRPTARPTTLSVVPTTRDDIETLRKAFTDAYQALLERKNAVLAAKDSKDRRQAVALFQTDLVSRYILIASVID